MTDEDRVNRFVNDVYLMQNARPLEDINDDDGKAEVNSVLAFCRMYLDELMAEKDPVTERPVDWWFARSHEQLIGTIQAAGEQVIPISNDILRPVVNSSMPLILRSAGADIGRFDMVDPSQILDPASDTGRGRACVVGRNLVFSRDFEQHEVGAEVVGDCIMRLPELKITDASLLDIVPYPLLVLGVVKNKIRPNFVQGGLTASFIEQYADELDKALAYNRQTSQSEVMEWQSFSHIGGI